MLTSFLFLCRENDVAGIDVNMGCPKDYSVKVQKLSCVIISQWHCLISACTCKDLPMPVHLHKYNGVARWGGVNKPYIGSGGYQ